MKYIDYKKEIKSFYSIYKNIKNNKMFNEYEIISYKEMLYFYDVIMEGYPLKPLVATQDVNGICTLNSMTIAFLIEIYEKHVISSETKAFLESIEFEIIYYFEKKDYDLTKFYRY